MVHAIFGLSHQTHPLDHGRPMMASLLKRLRRLARAGASDGELRAIVEPKSLGEARARNLAPPKNEAWLPMSLGGQLLLVEPQQSSDTTYSFADFYTPFVWDGERARFRKGDPRFGLCSREVALHLETADLSATSLSSVRQVPEPVVELGQHRAQLYRLIDDGERWPFFSVHRVELDGKPESAARWRGDHAPGVFQQLVVVRGEVELTDAQGGVHALGPSASAFIPATMRGGYQLASASETTVLAFSLPGPRGAMAAA
jgi:hypothetical protein